MVNREIAIATIAAIVISIPVMYYPVFQAQGASADPIHPSKEAHLILVKPAGSNMTGSAGNTTGGAHGSSIPTTHPAGAPTPSCPSRTGLC